MLALKNIEIGVSLRGFLFEFFFLTTSLVNYFQNQKYFSKMFFKTGFEVFSYVWSFPAFVSMLYYFPSHEQT